jgi:hypothetical protein
MHFGIVALQYGERSLGIKVLTLQSKVLGSKAKPKHLFCV